MNYRALWSIYNYYRDDDDESSTSVICLAIINELGRDHNERSYMKRAIEEFHQASQEAVDPPPVTAASKPSKSTYFLFILDYVRKLLLEAQENREEDNLMSHKYHFLRLLHEYQRRCNVEGKYLLAKEFAEHELCLLKEEKERGLGADMVKQKHNHDKNKIVAAHAKQMEEFRESEYRNSHLAHGFQIPGTSAPNPISISMFISIP